MSYWAENNKYLDTLRMTDSELAVIVSEELCRNSTERKWMRRPTNFMRMTIDTVQPGGTIGRFIVRSYDLSEGGIGFFTGNYIHSSTRCKLGMTTVDGESLTIDGTIAHCQNVWGHVHFAGVKFDTPIELSWFDGSIEASDPIAPKIPSEGTHEAAESNSYSVELVLAIVDELRDLITQEKQMAEIRACIERIEVALNPNDESRADGDDLQDGDEHADDDGAQLAESKQPTEEVPSNA
ncbi:MAG: hypothetical protein DHS20C16_12960 [Phycisphaerae bacterium]|nr:MAG: hypothetical protein DHS20C16_12960 [Phycisphaerae bacterium]